MLAADMVMRLRETLSRVSCRWVRLGSLLLAAETRPSPDQIRDEEPDYHNDQNYG
jgi:hypothetical protein